MKKIISLFKREYTGSRLVYDEVVPGAEWVLAGEGVATRKFDGTCCLMDGGKLFKRYELKHDRKAPDGFVPAQEPDPVTGDTPGWLPVGVDDKWHNEGYWNYRKVYGYAPESGTYELCGPKVQGNPEGFVEHVLIRHGCDRLFDAPRAFAGLKEYLSEHDIEGIVWHHPDGRMVKIKGKDFGIRRKGATR
jgi:hypothetical protein